MFIHNLRVLSLLSCLRLIADSLFLSLNMTSFSQPVAAADPRFNVCIEELLNDQQPPGANSPDLRSDLRIDELLQNRTPEGTRRNDSWALRKFDKWLKTTTFALQFDNFESIPLDRLNYILERFLVEICDSHKMKTAYAIITGLNRNLRSRYVDADLFSTKRFTRFRNVLDGFIKEKQSLEDTTVKKSGYITECDEQLLWSKCFGKDDPQKLLTTLIYLCAKTFALRGGDELYQLRVDSISVQKLPDQYRITYTERRSKNKQPGLTNINRGKW